MDPARRSRLELESSSSKAPAIGLCFFFDEPRSRNSRKTLFFWFLRSTRLRLSVSGSETRKHTPLAEALKPEPLAAHTSDCLIRPQEPAQAIVPSGQSDPRLLI